MGADASILFLIMTSYSSNELQPPLVLPRRGDADYLALLFPLWRCRLPCIVISTLGRYRLVLLYDKPMTVSLPMVSVPPLRGRLGGG